MPPYKCTKPSELQRVQQELDSARRHLCEELQRVQQELDSARRHLCEVRVALKNYKKENAALQMSLTKDQQLFKELKKVVFSNEENAELTPQMWRKKDRELKKLLSRHEIGEEDGCNMENPEAIVVPVVRQADSDSYDGSSEADSSSSEASVMLSA
ncbi:uncharacterized protein LOC111319311 [Stylophora pistillata]|uniref:uncharacterized protein LOC111319311 n=1 Tax=Stylophora pistillata TaxID=50429 RepID=UPI000C04B966|nr:uncharacterized protein LOC111319311 [Stylophora pistillata]